MLALLIATHFIIILFIKYVNLLIVKFLLFNAKAPRFLSIFVNQNAESLYYAKDDKEEYIGVNKAESSSMDVFFIEKELDHIVMHANPKGVFLTIDQLSETDKFLGSFKLLTER